VSRLKAIRTSLEVGFPGGELADRFRDCRGRDYRSIELQAEFPFEDAQFEVVILHASAVIRSAIMESHRVLRPEGRLYFTVPERTKKQDGMTLSDIYKLVREGFNIVEVERPPSWQFWRKNRTLTICAQKKNWRAHTNTFRPLV